jgi:hypothetical protein
VRGISATSLSGGTYTAIGGRSAQWPGSSASTDTVKREVEAKGPPVCLDADYACGRAASASPLRTPSIHQIGHHNGSVRLLSQHL